MRTLVLAKLITVTIEVLVLPPESELWQDIPMSSCRLYANCRARRNCNRASAVLSELQLASP